jgi:hypothetical protein
MANNKGTVCKKFVPALVVVGPADVEGLPGPNLVLFVESNAVENARRIFGKEHRKASRRFLKEIATRRLEDLSVSEVKPSLLTVKETPVSAACKGRDSTHCRIRYDMPPKVPYPGQPSKDLITSAP